MFGDERSDFLYSTLWYFLRNTFFGKLFWPIWVSKVSINAHNKNLRAELFRSPLFGDGVYWLDFKNTNVCPPNLAVFNEIFGICSNLSDHCVLFVVGPPSFKRALGQPVGRAPGRKELVFIIRSGIEIADCPRATSISRWCRADVEAYLYLIRRSGTVIGISGVYFFQLWLNVKWGAWAGVIKGYAFKNTVEQVLHDTSKISLNRGKHEFFFVETSSHARYRSARWLYSRLLEKTLSAENVWKNDTASLIHYGIEIPIDERN